MVYEFEKIDNGFYAIYVEDNAYGLLIRIGTPTIEEGKFISNIYLLNEEENIIFRVSKSYGDILKLSRGKFDAVEKMLEELAAESKSKANLDLLETFKEIRKDMKRRL